MNRILVPVDFSSESDRATQLACTFAKTLSLPLCLLHVFGASDDEPDAAEQALEAAVEGVRSQGIDCEASYAVRRPNSRIIEEACHPDTQLLVMGTHGREGLRRVLLGSFAETTQRGVTCPVISLNPRSRIPAQIETVVVGVDSSEGARVAFDEVMALAPRLGVKEIHLVHASDDAHPSEPQRAADWIPANDGGTSVMFAIEEGQVREVILRAAEEQRADLIALGTHGRARISRSVHGSIAESVMRRALCPVLSVRASDDFPEETS